MTLPDDRFANINGYMDLLILSTLVREMALARRNPFSVSQALGPSNRGIA
jgi:hypothetical protein